MPNFFPILETLLKNHNHSSFLIHLFQPHFNFLFHSLPTVFLHVLCAALGISDIPTVGGQNTCLLPSV